jgi:hypothetical protein
MASYSEPGSNKINMYLPKFNANDSGYFKYTGLTPPNVWEHPKSGTEFPTLYFVIPPFVFCELM